jgi:NADH-quinone oxidoreductase chain G
MIKVTINAKEIRLEKPVTVLEAAKMAGIKIPTLCHYPGLENYGGCRLCLVEVEKMPKLQTSCTLMVTDGMVVRTESDEIARARRAMLEFLLINHPLECPYCDKAGECDLQDLTVQYGPPIGRFAEGKRRHPESFDDPLIVRNMERCILCTRCIRMCDGVQGAFAITVTGRGNRSFVEPFSGGRYNCEYCGNCLTVCPVGAIMSRLHRHVYRAWQVEEKIKVLCPYCGVGCSMMLQVRSDSILRTLPEPEIGINHGILCARGRFGYGYVQSPERIRRPLIRKENGLEEVSWDEAIRYVSDRLLDIKTRYSGDAIGGIASPRCTNEENYLFQKLLRAGLNSNNIDSTVRFSIAPLQRYIEDVMGQGASANIMSGVVNSEAIIILGGDPVHINPVFGIKIREAFKKGVKVLTIGHMPGLQRFSSFRVNPYPYTEGILIGLFVSELLKMRNLSGENIPFEERMKSYSYPERSDLEEVCGIKFEDIEEIIRELNGLQSISIIIGPDIVTRTDMRSLIFLITSLCYILNARVFLLSERPNEQGVIDMGCLPDMLPGERPVEVDSFRTKFEAFWSASIPDKPGMSILEMIEAARSGRLKALYIMGENPAFNLPDKGYITEALKNLDLLVVQDIFMNETAEYAHVILPALTWSEKEGTFTNLERRIQRSRKAITAQGLEDWKIIAEIGKRLGLRMDYSSSSDIMAEISRVSPLYAGLTYDDLETEFNLWPYKGEPLRHKLGSGDWPLTELWRPLKRDSLYLTLEKHMFLSGTLSRHSSALNSIYERPVARISPEVASRFGIEGGDLIRIENERGDITVEASIDKTLSNSVVMLSNNFRDFGALSMVPFMMDPITKVFSINGIEVTIRKAGIK